jgi:hypothetical protein
MHNFYNSQASCFIKSMLYCMGNCHGSQNNFISHPQPLSSGKVRIHFKWCAVPTSADVDSGRQRHPLKTGFWAPGLSRQSHRVWMAGRGSCLTHTRRSLIRDTDDCPGRLLLCAWSALSTVMTRADSHAGCVPANCAGAIREESASQVLVCWLLEKREREIQCSMRPWLYPRI